MSIFFGEYLNYKSEIIKVLRQIPGVGISVANDLFDSGIYSIENLKVKVPENLTKKQDLNDT